MNSAGCDRLAVALGDSALIAAPCSRKKRVPSWLDTMSS